jgi:hypothetical protein
VENSESRMDKDERERRFDGILFSLAEQHPQGVLDVSFTISSLHPFVCHLFID